MKFERSLQWGPLQDNRRHASHLKSLQINEYQTLEARSQRINKSYVKRGLDIAVSAGLILFLLPALIAIGAAIKLSSPGPVLFRQQRYGEGRRSFWILKFRTMQVMEEQGEFQQASRNDVRVTRVGRWLRRSSMDELPQLLNVLAGQMSLVGPRPHAIPMDDYYDQILPGYAARHLVRPGLTGLAQIHGFRGPTDDLDSIAGRIVRDVAYIQTWSPTTDVKVLLLTPAALFGSNAF